MIDKDGSDDDGGTAMVFGLWGWQEAGRTDLLGDRFLLLLVLLGLSSLLDLSRVVAQPGLVVGSLLKSSYFWLLLFFVTLFPALFIWSSYHALE